MSEPTTATTTEDPEQVSAAEATAAATFLQQQQLPEQQPQPEDDNNINKWNKNGYGAPVPAKQTGKFTKEESRQMREAIEQFCAAKQISVARLCSECDHKAELKGAWMEISKSLPHRSVQSVYRHGIRSCHPFKRGSWSESEAATLADLVQRLGKKWSTIQQKMNRSADSCRDKYREMSEEFTKGRWREQETELLKRYIREQLNADPSADMQELGRLVEEQDIQIPWSTISKRMGKRSRLSCFKKWQKMTGMVPSEEYKRKPGEGEGEGPDAKRIKIEEAPASGASEQHKMAPTAGAAAAMAAANNTAGDYDIYSAKMAAETVEAVELPDTDTLVPSVREI